MAAAGFRHTRRITVQVLALFIGLFVLVAPTSSAATSSGSPSPSSSPTASASPSPGVTAALTQVTAVAPTWKTVGCGGLDNLITIPRVTGVEYVVNGIVARSGANLVTNFGHDGSSADVTARALAGYALVGKTSWHIEIPSPECVLPTLTTHCGSVTVTNGASYRIAFSWARASTFKWEGDEELAPSGTFTFRTKYSKLDVISAPADDGTLFSIEPLTVPQNCAAPSPSTTRTATATAPQPTSTGSQVPTPPRHPAPSTGPAIITDGAAGDDHANGALIAGGFACAFGCAVTGFGLRRRLRR
ncbi:MAG TPA: hypothetical protein VG502_18545 [Flexivirga sp.]|uniref:hypothetical protein n=1 Tax=Flexivirga sp. TaxID=1962927 RepID=UPI002BEB63B8|nr:hypothetical protein [Flexivirga sp.]HWC24299.1 hypothetical protein [Flexivirga sp.]